MKTVSTFLQILALSACFTAQVHGAFSMPGVRQALRTIASSNGQILSPISILVEIAKGA
jgi:hypothetical protein